MKAAIADRYGPPEVLKIAVVPEPVPAADELLIRVHATTVNRTDCGELTPRPPLLGRMLYGLVRPRRKIFGLDFAGVVEAAGADVTLFGPGDRVFGMCPSRRDGAHAEYVCVRETGAVAPMPAGKPFSEAVVCEGAFYASAGLDRFAVGTGHSILVYGASGAIGSAAVQLAKASGARVTAVAAARHQAMLAALGADRVIDYTAQDITRIGETFDFVFEAVGKMSYFRLRSLLGPQGVFIATDLGPWGENLPLMLWSLILRSQRVVVPLPAAHGARGFVHRIKALIESGQFRALIDRVYPLDSIVEAYRYVEAGQKTGIVVLAVADDGLPG